ncbi:non-ribosomal peptide synthetase [Legionella yabuuchiae]|uniref:non-ribosomal peptide synthetase n=1 Tax=Legionella yabuuchiae TaxID=376727 RepID=UPI0010558E84|nr:non-ribosomal peptide synthetase [Legionella yabuuchiae]
MLKEKNYQEANYDWNNTDKENLDNKLITHLFEEQVRNTPDALAVIYHQEQLTYKALNDKSNQLARYLQSQAIINPDTLIAICLNRGLDMIIGILAIMKANGAYVPIDPGYPQERIGYILEDTKAQLLLTQSTFHPQLEALTSAHIVVLDRCNYSSYSTSNLFTQCTGENLAYVIYTSGTTGQPKGATTIHSLLVNRLLWQKDTYAFSSHDNVLQKTPFVFDVSVWELLLPLIAGSRLVFAKTNGHKDVEYLYNIIESEKISKLHFVPTMLSAFLSGLTINKTKNLSGISDVFCSGEALPVRLANQFKQLFPTVKLHNLYGPTEVAIDVSAYSDIPANADLIHIGKPINNIVFYILDKYKKPVPPGVIGELYIAAPHLNRGYLNQPVHSAEKFILNPFATDTDIKQGRTQIYKTGDLVRWLVDGNVEYIGRNDFQVKIRGYRIELAEIEHVLTSIDGVTQACVLNKYKNETQYLVGYLIIASNCELNDDFIFNQLQKKLPEYMVPDVLIRLTCFPLTINGKLDRKALPDPQFISNSEYVPPSTDLEIQIVSIWQNILKINNIGLTDDFFKLGGNSISAICLVSQINLELGVQVSVKDIYKHKTISQLLSIIQHSTGNFIYQDFLITKGFTDEHLPFELTNVQQAYLYGRLADFEMSNVSAHHYSELFFSHFHVARFEEALNQLINIHSSLRTVFQDASQSVIADVPFYKIKQHGQITQNEFAQIRARLSHKVYQSDCWPLFDFELSEVNGQLILHISIDVLILDGISIRLFFNQLAQHYNVSNSAPLKTTHLEINFKDYVQKYHEVRASSLYLEAKHYWLNKLDQYNFEAKIPLAAIPGTIIQPKFIRKSATIQQKKWQLIKDKAYQFNLSLTCVVLYAYGLILSKWSGHSHFCINLTLFNRLPLHKQVNELLGDFTVLELFNFKRSPNETIYSGIEKVHNELWEDIEHNLFDGIDFQRLIRKNLGISQEQSLSPVVLTSLLGGTTDSIPLDGHIGNGYSISQTSQVYLDNKAYENEEGFIAEWDYVEQLFAPHIIEEMHDDYCAVLELFAELKWDQPLPPLTLSTKDQFLITKANSDIQPEIKQTLVDLFLSHVKTAYKQIAVIDSQGTYTYGEIYLFSEYITHHLLSRITDKSQKLIGILSEKSYQQVVAALGIMRSGMAYLPLHIDWPEGRISSILKEAAVNTILISQSAFSNYIKGKQIEDEYCWLIIGTLINSPPPIKNSQLPKINFDDVAYVIYTSGSTGKPKGVTIAHQAAVNTITAVNNRFQIKSTDKILALSDLGFDLSVYDIFGVLGAAGTVVFPDQEQIKEPSHWYELIVTYQITLWNTVPQLMQLLAVYVTDRGKLLTPLTTILLSGDWIPLQLPNQLKSLTKNATIMSLGGATEGAIWSIWYEIKNIQSEWASIPYGYAMPNQKMYVLNSFQEQCPVDVTGEIHIGGMGVALGYWNDEEKSQARFINHSDLGRLYKTGDSGKWHQDGYIIFQGRKDFQVKLNGYRVELEEISHHLTQLEGIDGALTRVHENRLIAYLLSSSFKKSQEKENKEHFILEQHNIRTDLAWKYSLNPLLCEKKYRRRKSYRYFLHEKNATPFLPAPHHLNNWKRPFGKPICLGQLTSILQPLSALILKDKITPKYIYPSGGSTYAIQSYLSIPARRIHGVEAGEYYYNPVTYQLQHTNSSNSVDSFKIDFKLYLPAIEPLYQEKSSRLAYLEMGHILYCLEQVLTNLNIGYDIEIRNEKNDMYHSLLTIHFDNLLNPYRAPALKKVMLVNQSGYFHHPLHSFDLKKQSIFMQISEQGQLLANAEGILALEGTHTPEHYIQAGFEAQGISELWYERNIGSCTIGLMPYDEAIYALAFGSINKAMLGESQSMAQPISLDRYISEQLKLKLPFYMVPETYFKLNHFPLTANGKIDLQSLPLPDFSLEKKYIAPETQLEKDIAQIWQEILQIERVGLNDDFFRIGGNSILAIQMVNKLNNHTGLHIKVTELFKNKTIATLLERLTGSGNAPRINATERTTAPLSFAQERLWFIENYEQGTNAYHIPLCIKLNASDLVDAMKKSLQTILVRHEILRTVYLQNAQGEYYQEVTNLPLIFLEETISEQQLEYKLSERINQHFDLRQELPIRVVIFRSAVHYYFSITIHHIAFDGWSSAIFIDELAQLYHYYLGKTPLNLSSLPIQYIDFALWQRDYFQGDILKNQIKYWQKKLKNTEILYFPCDYTRTKKIDYRGNRIFFTLDSQITQKIKNLAKTVQVTQYTLLLSGFYILLNKYTGQEDILIGTPVANRHYSQIEHLIGFFVNTLVIRQTVSPQGSIKALAHDIHQTVLQAQKHQDLPFEKLVEILNIERDPGRHPLFQIMFRVQNFIDNKDFDFYEVDKFLKASQFDFDLLINDNGPEFKGQFTYLTSLFKRETAERIIAHYVHILERMCENPHQLIKDILIISKEEYHQTVYQWNNTDRDFLDYKRIEQLFEDQVLKAPHHIALVHQNNQMTYFQLNEKANQLARYLRSKAVLKSNTIIALCLNRGMEMIITLLAIMKTGAAYLPVDPEYPSARINYMLNDSQTPLVITHSSFVKKLQGGFNAHLLLLDTECYKYHNSTNLNIKASMEDLAYVIYTSGTTGKPKGVMISHSSVFNYLKNVEPLLHYVKNMDYSSNLSFDLSVTTTLLPLICGKKICIYDGHLTEFKRYINHLNKHKIDFLKATPSFLNHLPLELLTHKIHACFIGGEQSDVKQIDYIKNYIDNIYDEYGPTEATVGATNYLCKNNSHSIGKPYNNYKVYVLDKQGNPLPIGIVGELHIAGAGLARGYLNNPELSTEKFAVNSLATPEDIEKGYMRRYKTGDLVRWLPDGNLQYIGRNDSQVKIRGHRIELSEVEQALSSIDGIKQACAVVKTTVSSQFLVGYVVLEINKSITTAHILTQLHEQLPDYMVPDVLIHLPVFPLTANGKLDKTNLPEAFFMDKEVDQPPSTDLEKRLAAIWNDVLKIKNTGVTDDFFKIGGTSLSAMQVSYLMSNELKCDVKVADLFRYKTISQIIKHSLLEAKPDSSCLILLSANECINKECIFLVHGVGGNILSYYQIIKQLEKDYNVYGIQARGLHSNQKCFESYQQMITVYSTEMKNVLKNNGAEKYHIIGWSYGVAVALELISALQKNARCKNAFLIDGSSVADRNLKSLHFKLNNSDLSDDLKTLILFYKNTYRSEGEINNLTEDELFHYAHQLFGYPSTEKEFNKIKRRVNVALHNIKNLLSFSQYHTPTYCADKFHIINADQTKNGKTQWHDILNCDYISTMNFEADHWSIMVSNQLLTYLKCQLLQVEEVIA